MHKSGILRLQHMMSRMGRRLPAVPRAVRRNVFVVWCCVIVVVGGGALWYKYAQRNPPLLRLAKEEWQASVDKVSEWVPDAVVRVAERQEWTKIALNSALPRRAPRDDDDVDLGKVWGGDDEVSLWSRAVDLAMSVALGYDVADTRAVMATAVPAATNVHVSTERAGPAPTAAESDRIPSRTPVKAPAPPAPPPPKESSGLSRPDDAATPVSAAAERLQETRIGGNADGCPVVIFHTHSSETYRSDSFAPTDAEGYHLWNSTDAGVVQVGRTLKRALEERFGIPTCHLTTIHDWPSHARAYVESRSTVEAFLKQNPQAELVLDVHRDSPSGLVTTIAGDRAAQVAIVVGTHPTMHPRSTTNVAVAAQMGRFIDQRYPSMFRRVIERPDARLNQDLHPRALILEVGSYDTHLDEALHTGDLLADVVADTLRWLRSRPSGAVDGLR